MEDDSVSDEVASALYFKWLLAKYEVFWFASFETEVFVKETWPDLPCFSALDLELLVKHMLYLIDGDNYLITKASHDQGIDLSYEECLDPNFGAFAKTIVQCKLYRGYVPVSELRDFFGVMTAHVAKGLFITTGNLTSQGTRFHPLANESPYANRLYIVSKQQLADLLDIVRNLTDLLLHNDIDLDDENEFGAWAKNFELQKTGVTEYGKKYQIHGKITGPNEKSMLIVTAWIVLKSEDFPRFITAYPGV